MKNAAIFISALLLFGGSIFGQENPEESFIFYGENAQRCNNIIETLGARGFLSDSCKMVGQNMEEIMAIMEWAAENKEQIEDRDEFLSAAKEIGETIRRAKFYHGRLGE